MVAETAPTSNDSSSLKRQFILNAASGWVTQVVAVLIGFISLPYAIWRLGAQSYGIYQLGASALVLFSILQLGMGPTLVRYCSRAIVENNKEKIGQVSSTSLLMLGSLGIFGSILSLMLIPLFLKFYTIPQHLVWESTGLMICMSITFFLRMILPAITGILLGANRYDISNSIVAIGHILRLGLMIAFFELIHPSILFFGFAILLSQLFQVLLMFVFGLKFIGTCILFSFRNVRLDVIRSMLSFSSLNLINIIAETITIQGPVLIIGKVLGEEMVTAFAPALVIASAVRGFLAQSTRPLVPLATQKSRNQEGNKNLGSLSIKIGMVTAFIGFGITLPFAIFGRELISLWLGHELAWTWTIIAVIAISTAVTHIQDSNYFLALGGGSIVAVVASQAVIAIVVVLGTAIGMVFLRWQLLNVALFFSLCVIVRSAIYLSYAYSKQFSYHYGLCLLQVYCRPAVICIGSVITGLLIKHYWPTNNIFLLGTEFAITGILYTILGWAFILPSDIKTALLDFLPKRSFAS